MKQSVAWHVGLPLTSVSIGMGLSRAIITGNVYLGVMLGLAGVGFFCMILGKHQDAKNMLDYLKPKR